MKIATELLRVLALLFIMVAAPTLLLAGALLTDHPLFILGAGVPAWFVAQALTRPGGPLDVWTTS